MVNINAYLQQLRQDAIKGFAELSEHPVKYTSKALADFVKDYWDVGFSLASALAWTPYGREIFSEKVQAYFAGLGLPVSLVAGGSMHLRDKEKAAARIVRNGGAWFASMSLGNGFSSLDGGIDGKGSKQSKVIA
ncbi:MAG: hypothetical protein HYS80_01775 [Candidatus Aenigmarchaeota archaeon]|nr:hypothetical protein [Candidatus Aenigmarchaeota archaeon]